jgi:S-adenosylmethionine:tRNA ribosyltransferase-isomerase
VTTVGLHPLTRFDPPDDLTADSPPERRGLGRDGVRLLVAESSDGRITLSHRHFRDIVRHIHPGDVLVVNNSATVAGEVDAAMPGRGAVVVHVGGELDDCTWVVELRTAPDAAAPILDAEPGDIVELANARDGEPVRLRLEAGYPADGSSPSGVGNRLWQARQLDGCTVAAHLESHGRPIAYGYLRARFPLGDYQTVFGVVPGSAEMASAGRPFTSDLVTTLVASGVALAPVTLHTGLSSQDAGELPQPERFAVSGLAADLVNAAVRRRGRVIAVGTTATRAIESATDEHGVVHPAAGWTDLVISPARPARVVTGLVTGWHNPDASHLLLVESVAGPELTQAAYSAASAGRYAWHEFGDSALFLP